MAVFKNCDTLNSPQRTAGEPNYEAAVVPQFIFSVPQAHTLLGFGVQE